MFNPEQWGQVDRLAAFFAASFPEAKPIEHRAVSGVRNHFRKALILHALAHRIAPALEIDRQQLDTQGYTAGDHALELAAVVETVFLELYACLDCTRKVVIGRYPVQGMPDSTRKMFARARSGMLDSVLPDDLLSAFKEADWYDPLRILRDELTHLQVGYVSEDPRTKTLAYLHSGLGTPRKAMVIEDIFKKWHELTITKGGMTRSAQLSGSRAYSSVYQNTTGSVMVLAIQIGTGGTSILQSDSSNPPTAQIWKQAITGTRGTCFAIILPGHYYKLTNTGSGSIVAWYEYTWDTVAAVRSEDLSAYSTIVGSTSAAQYYNATGKSLWTCISVNISGAGTLLIRSNLRKDNACVPLQNTGIYLSAMSDTGAGVRNVCGPVDRNASYAEWADSATTTTINWYEWTFS